MEQRRGVCGDLQAYVRFRNVSVCNPLGRLNKVVGFGVHEVAIELESFQKDYRSARQSARLQRQMLRVRPYRDTDNQTVTETGRTLDSCCFKRRRYTSMGVCR